MHFNLEKIKHFCYRPLNIGSFKIPFAIPIFAFSFILFTGVFLRSCSTSQNSKLQSNSNIENKQKNKIIPAVDSPSSPQIINSIDISELTETVDDFISSGEEILNINAKEKDLKIAATELYREGEYLEAAKAFKKSWDTGNKDPETLIYLNNALIESTAARHYTIAVVVPFTDKTNTSSDNLNDISKEILRGVAKSQEEVNLQLFTSNLYNEDYSKLPNIEILKQKILQGRRLKIILATDSNDREQGKKVASQLVRIPFLLGVIGHYSSDVTIDTIDIYNKNKVTLVSANSNEGKLINHQRKFFFKSIPSLTNYADALVNYLIDTLGITDVAVFYDPDRNSFSYSYWQEFKTKFEQQQGKIVLKYDNLSAPKFNSQQVIKEIEQEATAIKKIAPEKEIAIILLPNGEPTNTFNNAQKIIELNNDLHWIIGAETLYNPATIQLHQDKSLEKITIAVPWQYSNTINSNFVKESQLAWQKKMSYRAAFSYDAMQVLLKALNSIKIDKPTSQDIHAKITQAKFNAQGATGTIEFDSKGNRLGKNVELVTIINCNSQTKTFVSLARTECFK